MGRSAGEGKGYPLQYSCLENAMDCSPPGSSVHGILQAGILEWVAFPFCRGSSQPGIEPRSPVLQADSLPSEPPGGAHETPHTHSASGKLRNEGPTTGDQLCPRQTVKWAPDRGLDGCGGHRTLGCTGGEADCVTLSRFRFFLFWMGTCL